MPMTVKTIPPFFNDNTAAPPPFPPMLTNQLELYGNTSHSCLLTDKVNNTVTTNTVTTAITISKDKPTQRLRTTRSSSPYMKKVTATRSSLPYAKKVTFSRRSQTRSPSHALSHASMVSTSEESDCSSESDNDDNDDTSSMLSEDSKIPKPPGEPGHPGRGGYNLEIALDWNQKSFAKLKKLTHHLINEHLNITKCASAQNPALINVIRTKAIDAFPDLEAYSNCWPINDIIMMRLKYTSSHAWHKEIEMAAGKGKKAKGSVRSEFTVSDNG
ncbi:hypothetical protein EDD15DRAFT_2359879 [Pisolithus albus]|nr:hypothetical protein EDD15DRAFT_2359879 [Pisolithus albus]